MWEERTKTEIWSLHLGPHMMRRRPLSKFTPDSLSAAEGRSRVIRENLVPAAGCRQIPLGGDWLIFSCITAQEYDDEVATMAMQSPAHQTIIRNGGSTYSGASMALSPLTEVSMAERDV